MCSAGRSRRFAKCSVPFQAVTRILLHGNRPESGWTKPPDRLALRTELGWQERPFRTCFLFCRRPRVASVLAALVSTPPLGWVKSAALPGLLGKANAQCASEPADTTKGRTTEQNKPIRRLSLSQPEGTVPAGAIRRNREANPSARWVKLRVLSRALKGRPVPKAAQGAGVEHPRDAGTLGMVGALYES